jgi:hypothetical protein
MKSIDTFLTSLSRIQAEIEDKGKVPLLKFWVRRTLPPAAAAGRAPALGDRPVLGRLGGGRIENPEKRLDQGMPGPAQAGTGVVTKPECAVKSIDGLLTSL